LRLRLRRSSDGTLLRGSALRGSTYFSAGTSLSATAAAAASCLSLRRSKDGIVWRVAFWMSFSRLRSSSEQKLMAMPSLPLRAVRPIRWT
jgi:hypothetical protein